jgi:riboflavin biosynthesis pyrimidine reductase
LIGNKADTIGDSPIAESGQGPDVPSKLGLVCFYHKPCSFIGARDQHSKTKKQNGNMASIAPLEKIKLPVIKTPLERPFVHVNFSINQQGQMNLSCGAAIDLSCPKDWQRVHELRELYSAVVVGAKTWARDNPRLTARQECLGRVPRRQPDRVIFAGNTPCKIKADSRRSFLVGTTKAEHVKNIPIDVTDWNLETPLKALRTHKVETLLVEGGKTLLKSFISQRVVDYITIYVRTKSLDQAITAVDEAFPELPAATMQAELFGRGVLLSHTPDEGRRRALS